MKNEEERLKILDELFPMKQESCLVFGINRDGIITRFNDDFELLTGKSKQDVLNKPISTIFSDDPYLLDKWMDVISQARANKPINDIELPLQTRSGEDIIVSWTNFPVNEEGDGPVSVLNLVGTPIVKMAAADKPTKNEKAKGNKKIETKKKKQDTPTKVKQKDTKVDTKHPKSDETTEKTDDERKQSKPKKKKKKLKISKKTYKPSKSKKEKTTKIKTNAVAKKSTEKKKEKPVKKTKPIKETDSESSNPLIKKILGKKKAKSEKSNKKIKKKSILPRKKKPSSDKSDTSNINKLVKELKRENDQLRKENLRLEHKLDQNGMRLNDVQKVIAQQFNFLLDCIGLSKRRHEFNQMMNQMQERKLKLEHLETDMILEKKEFKQKIEEFFAWREKLEQLEQEIEKRRQYLNEQETFLNEQYDKVLNHELETPASYVTEISQPPTEGEEHAGVVEQEDLFESLVATAAVLQRGRIKKVNKLFLELLGYTENDLIGKHLVDFVSPIGLSGIEQHYVNRLKGMDDLSYTTVFLTKDQEEIPVKVSVKTGEFLGQRAEIATFQEQ